MSPQTFSGSRYDTNQLAQRAMLAYSEMRDLKYVEVDPNLRIVGASPGVETILSEHIPDLEGVPIGHAFWELYGADDALNDIILGKASSYQLDHVSRTLPDGTSVYLKYRIEPIDRQQPNMGLLLFIEDATPSGILEQSLTQERNELWLLQRQLAEANESLEQLNQFKSFVLSMAAHDIANPLNVISVYVEFLLSGQLDLSSEATAKRLLTVVKRQSQYLSTLLKNLLDLDRVEKGELGIHKTACSLNAIVVEVVDTLSTIAAFEHVSVSLDLSIEPHIIQADPDRLRQILYNLVNNAVKYTPEGGSIVLHTGLEADQVVFQISDSGCGMTEDEMAQLFELYYRTEEALESNITGSGLGLFIVNELVKAHNGQIDVSSEYGAGSTFTVRFPATSKAVNSE